MNYYPMHVGDYASATLHLSCTEDLFFRRMLDLYYTHEKPLPPDFSVLCRKLRAGEPDQRDAVRAVLKEFFERTPEGWRQKRCDREIANSELKRVAASLSANLRWHGQAEGAATSPKGRVASRAKARQNTPPDASPDVAAGTASDADAMRTHATALPTHADAMPAQCEGNAPNTNTNTNTNTTPNPNPTTATAPAAVAVGDVAAVVAVADAQAKSQADLPIPDPPRAVADWINFFGRAGFDGKPLASPLLRAQAQRWIDQGVTLAVMREAMADARTQLKGLPGTPRYYAWAVDAVMKARGLAQEHAALNASAAGAPPPPAAAYAGHARYGVPESI